MSNQLNVPVQQRLERPTDDRRIGGVASGIAQYVNIDPIFIRAGFLLSFFIGVGPFLYPLIWLVMPSENQTHASWSANFAEMRRWIGQLFSSIMNKLRSKPQAQFDPMTGKPINAPRPRFDPMTGEPINDIPINNVSVVKAPRTKLAKRNVISIALIGLLALMALPVLAESGLLLAVLIIGAGILLMRKK